jgi:hypothetical protein
LEIHVASARVAAIRQAERGIVQNWGDLNQQIERLGERLKTDGRGRDQRLSLALDLLADVEARVQAQRTALEQANLRIATLEAERSRVLARLQEIFALYESSVRDGDALFQRIEGLSARVAGNTAGAAIGDRPAAMATVDGAPSRAPADAAAPVRDEDSILRLYAQVTRDRMRTGGTTP